MKAVGAEIQTIGRLALALEANILSGIGKASAAGFRIHEERAILELEVRSLRPAATASGRLLSRKDFAQEPHARANGVVSLASRQITIASVP